MPFNRRTTSYTRNVRSQRRRQPTSFLPTHTSPSRTPKTNIRPQDSDNFSDDWVELDERYWSDGEIMDDARPGRRKSKKEMEGGKKWDAVKRVFGYERDDNDDDYSTDCEEKEEGNKTKDLRTDVQNVSTAKWKRTAE